MAEENSASRVLISCLQASHRASRLRFLLRRPLNELFDLLNTIQATALEPHGPINDSNRMPEFPPKSCRNDSLLAQWCAQMTAFLSTHRCGMLKLHPDWLKFLIERDEDKGARMHMTAVDFILQPFPMDKCYIPRGSRHEIVIDVKEQQDHSMPRYIVWKFELEDFDVDFSVSYAPKPYEQPVEIVHARTRYLSTTTSRAVEGSYRCLKPGKATLVWDNSYSRLRGKNVLYQVQVITSSIMESAITAADALDEAVQAEKIRDEKRDAALSTALIVSSGTPLDQVSGYSAYIPDAIAQQSWLLSTPINVAGHLAWKLFGSPEKLAVVSASRNQHSSGSDSEARSLLEELNGLNMQLMERMESLEDSVGKLTTERDQERSKTHMAIAKHENFAIELKAREQELASLKGELERIQRERQAWREIQAERDALLEEKHRWAMMDDFDGDGGEISNYATEMDMTARNRLEQELGQAEAAVLRCRAELGYPLSNHLTGTSTRLEKVAREMTATKQQYEERMQAWENERLQLTQELVKARGQRRVLVTEIRNMRTQTEGQIAVAMAEASEARMVNQRLKRQNELLLTQIRTLINEAEDHEKKLIDAQQDFKHQTQGLHLQSQSVSETETSMAMLNLSVKKFEDETTTQDKESPVPYTLSENDIAILNGCSPSVQKSLLEQESQVQTSSTASYRARLVAFLKERDPEKLIEVDEMLASYKGVEASLFESLELKYSFMELNRRIAQSM
ncbi:hypothetical protein PPTG_00953 [Plasmopara halstedii]|uniref:GOLD domain-containing protein n=1 Tax=Plasmopara halstedii TaxID=4781 RepID=A0A0P1APH1_PLAHL|nr:hypothetical protein PPTG_00953 [Plasmopara halstedii]CEG43084.1 hypothetical protein PPTG_00953 [Plasmopara halstedii]|eukprot:XP_024579453.1 hypothetical protein PPTG_00953 [Plasmopara halstedii]